MGSNAINTQSFDYTQEGFIESFRPIPCLTVIYHPDAERLGDRAALSGPGPHEISRIRTSFGKQPGQGGPLGESHISRTPFSIHVDQKNTAVKIVLPRADYRIKVDGERVGMTTHLGSERLQDGEVLQIGKRVYLLLHLRRQEFEHAHAPSMPTLIGDSDAMDAVRLDIRRVAALDVPVLIRGESGTGKELVAQAVHIRSRRSRRAFIPVNMAAISGHTASSELFGHAKGAFTGAVRDHDGYFVQGNTGTVFLDEVGELKRDVQGLLLRMLESSEVQRIGGGPPRKVDVRVLAATDAHLEELVTSGLMSMPFLQRINGYTIWVPALRNRRCDIPQLFVHFLYEFLRETGETRRLELGAETDWLRPSDMLLLVRHHWPGNVRELRNIARQTAIHSIGKSVLSLPPMIRDLLDEDELLDESTGSMVSVAGTMTFEDEDEDATVPPGAMTAPPTPVKRNAQSLTDEDIRDALGAHQWRLKPAAEALGIARSTLYKRVEESDLMRVAADLNGDEIQAALEANNGNVRRAAAALEVSFRGLQMRLKSDLR